MMGGGALGVCESRFFYTEDGVLTLTDPAVPEARNLAALAIVRYLPVLQSVFFTKRAKDVLECNSPSGEGLENVYIQTSNEESLCLQRIVQTIMTEEATAWSSLQEHERRGARSRDAPDFSSCVLVVGSTVLSDKGLQNLVVSDLHPPLDTAAGVDFYFYEALYLHPGLGSKRAGRSALQGIPEFILPGCVLLLENVCFSLRVPQFPKLMIGIQSRVWDVQRELPHDWSVARHLEVQRLFARLHKGRAAEDDASRMTPLGRAIYTRFFNSMQLKPLSSFYLSNSAEQYKQFALLSSAETVGSGTDSIQLRADPQHGDALFRLSEVRRSPTYLSNLAAAITRQACNRKLVLVLLSGMSQHNIITVNNTPSKFLLYVSEPFEELLHAKYGAAYESATEPDPQEPPLKGSRGTGAMLGVNDDNPETRGFKEGPLLASILPPYAIASRDVCYSPSPDALTFAVQLAHCSVSKSYDLRLSNITLLWHHIQGRVYPYHRYTRLDGSQTLVYTSGPNARILDENNLLLKVFIHRDKGGGAADDLEDVYAVAPHIVLHDWLVQVAGSQLSGDALEIQDPETARDLGGTLPCVWPRYALCMIHRIDVPQAELRLLHSTRMSDPFPETAGPTSQDSLHYLIKLAPAAKVAKP